MGQFLHYTPFGEATLCIYTHASTYREQRKRSGSSGVVIMRHSSSVTFFCGLAWGGDNLQVSLARPSLPGK